MVKPITSMIPIGYGANWLYSSENGIIRYKKERDRQTPSEKR
tara:strand:- start:834 stop:959 length:126 start_codon:yes stop_codon:yes gene_type:complete